MRICSIKNSFNDQVKELIHREKIPVKLVISDSFDEIDEADILLIDKEFYKSYDIRLLKNKTSYIIYLLEPKDYDPMFIKELYKNNIFDIFNSIFIKEEVLRKLNSLVKLLNEENTDQILDLILDSIEDSIAITDEEGTLEYVNRGFLKTTGYELDEVIGSNPRVIKSDGHTPGFYKNMWNTIRNGEIWNGDFINLSKDNKLFYEEASIYPIQLSSKKYLKIAHNISKDKFIENKVKLSMSLAKNVLGTSAPSEFSNGHVTFRYFVKYMNELGGDFIWFNQLGQSKYIMVLIDVTGHDLSSTLILMTIINYIKEFDKDTSLEKLVKQINDYLNDFNQKSDMIKLISGIFCVINTDNYSINYINAGHPSGLLYDRLNQDILEMKKTTMLLGVRLMKNFDTYKLDVKESSDLILYSDGLLEHFIDDYSTITSESYKDIFYQENSFSFDDIKESLLKQEYIKDDLSLAYVKIKCRKRK